MKIFLIGFMASGKTTIAKQLSHIINLPYVDVDKMVENLANLSIYDIFKKYGEKTFRKIETKVFKILKNKDDIIVSTGGASLCFKKNLKQIEKNSIIIYLDCKLKTCLKRASFSDIKRPLLNQNKKEIKILYSTRKKIYENLANFKVLNNKKQEICLNKIVKILKNFISF